MSRDLHCETEDEVSLLFGVPIPNFGMTPARIFLDKLYVIKNVKHNRIYKSISVHYISDYKTIYVRFNVPFMHFHHTNEELLIMHR